MLKAGKIKTSPRLELLLRAGKRQRALLEALGTELVAASHRAFKLQKFGREDWRPRAVPNVAGMLSDFSAGMRDPKPTRFQERPALVDTGRLRDSIQFVTRRTSVVVFSTVPYSGLLQEGGEKTIRITDTMRSGLRRWIRRNPGEDSKRPREVVKLQEVKIKIPARPFLGTPPDTMRRLRRLVARFMAGKKV